MLLSPVTGVSLGSGKRAGQRVVAGVASKTRGGSVRPRLVKVFFWAGLSSVRWRKVPAGPCKPGRRSPVPPAGSTPSRSALIAPHALASSDAAVGVRVIGITTRTVIATLPHPAPVTSVRFTPDGTTVLTRANDGMARLWPVPGPTLALPYTVSSTVFDRTGRTFAVGSGDPRLWNLADPQRPRQYGPPMTNEDGFASSVAFTPD